MARHPPEPSDITCVIPTHDRPEYLREAIQSVLDQVEPVGEVVVVADAEHLALSSVAEEFSTSSVPVRFVDRSFESKPGVSRSRNLGASHSSRRWISFLDDDDRWDPEFTTLMCRAARGHDFVLGSKQVLIGGQLGPLIPARGGLRARDVFRDLSGAHGGNILLPKDLAEQIPYDEQFQAAEDWDLFYRLLHHGATYAVVDEPVVQYRHHGPQVSRDPANGAVMVRRLYAKHRATIDWRARRHLRFRAAWLERRWAPTRPSRLRAWAELTVTAPYPRLIRKRSDRLRRRVGQPDSAPCRASGATV